MSCGAEVGVYHSEVCGCHLSTPLWFGTVTTQIQSPHIFSIQEKHWKTHCPLRMSFSHPKTQSHPTYSTPIYSSTFSNDMDSLHELRRPRNRIVPSNTHRPTHRIPFRSGSVSIEAGVQQVPLRTGARQGGHGRVGLSTPRDLIRRTGAAEDADETENEGENETVFWLAGLVC